MIEDEFSMIEVVGAEVQFSSDFSKRANHLLYDSMHPDGRLLAEGHDNFGCLPPLTPDELSIELVSRDTLFGVRASA